MRRREFISLLGGVATASLAGRPAIQAQEAKRPVRIGFLPFGSPTNVYDRSLVEAFQTGLRQTGLVENQDIILDIVWTGAGDPGQMCRAASAMIKSRWRAVPGPAVAIRPG